MLPKARIVWFRGKWCAYWREDGEPKRRVLADESGAPVASREDAERVLIDVQRLAIAPASDLIGDLAEKYFGEKKGRVESYDNLESAWRQVKPRAAHLRADQITRDWCRTYTGDCHKRKLSDGTIRKHLTVLSAICRWSDKRSPAVIELPPMPAPRDRVLTRPEAQCLIEAADAHHVRLFIILALATGARTSALLELTWDRVDFDRGRIDLGNSPTRNKKRATVPMTDTARFALKAAHDGRTTDAVIEWGGASVKSVKKGFGRAVVRAKLKGVTPHVLRHTAAVWMAESGTPMSEISQHLGHTRTTVTERVYAKYSPEYLRRGAAALELEIGPRVQKNTGAHPNTGKKTG